MSKRHVGITWLTKSCVRSELYAVWNKIREFQNLHLTHIGHPTDCRVCFAYDKEVDGIRRAIKHFGGNPRRKGW
jgi:hypothetical protein